MKRPAGGSGKRSTALSARKSKTAAAKKAADELRLSDSHPNHDKHLCHIVNLRNMKTVAKLSKDAKYVCYLCGRAAKNKVNLCLPVEI